MGEPCPHTFCDRAEAYRQAGVSLGFAIMTAIAMAVETAPDLLARDVPWLIHQLLNEPMEHPPPELVEVQNLLRIKIDAKVAETHG